MTAGRLSNHHDDEEVFFSFRFVLSAANSHKIEQIGMCHDKMGAFERFYAPFQRLFAIFNDGVRFYAAIIVGGQMVISSQFQIARENILKRFLLWIFIKLQKRKFNSRWMKL